MVSWFDKNISSRIFSKLPVWVNLDLMYPYYFISSDICQEFNYLSTIYLVMRSEEINMLNDVVCNSILLYAWMRMSHAYKDSGIQARNRIFF